MKKEIKDYIICLCAAAVLISSFSSSTSPFYSIFYGDYYGNSSSTALLVGKAWLSGNIPYGDLFVTGGPLYYIIQSLGWFLGGRSGVFGIQIFNMSIILFLLQCLFKLLLQKESCWSLVVISAVGIAATLSGGNSKEEYCLTLSLLLFVYILKTEIEDKFSWKSAVVTGLLASAVIGINITSGAMIYAIIFYVIFILFWKRGWRTGIQALGRILFIMILCFIPFFVYFYLQNYLWDMIQGTFFYPIRSLVAEGLNLILLLHKLIKSLPFLLLFIIGIIIFRVLKLKKGILYTFLGLSFFIFGILGDGNWHLYLIGSFALSLSLSLVWKYFDGAFKKIGIGVLIVCMLGIYTTPIIRYGSFVLTDDVSGYKNLGKDLKTYCKENNTDEVFMVDVPAFIYLAADVLPDYKYFSQQSEYEKIDSSIRKKINRYVTESCKAPVIIIKSRGMAYQEIGDYSMAAMYNYGKDLLSVYQR